MDEANLIETLLDAVLRIPPLFILDSIMKCTFLWPWAPDEVSGLMAFVWALFNVMCFVSALILFLLEKETLVLTYKILSLGTNIFISFYFNKRFVEEGLQRPNSNDMMSVETFNFLINLAVQIAVSATFSWFHVQPTAGDNKSVFTRMWDTCSKYIYYVALLPLVLRAVGANSTSVQKSPKVACFITVVAFMGLFVQRLSLARQIKSLIRSLRDTLRHFGIQAFIELHWTRLHIPNVLRLFWFVRTLYIFSYLLANYARGDIETDIHDKQSNFSGSEYHNVSHEFFSNENATSQYKQLDNTNLIKTESFLGIFPNLLILSCDTVFALMALTSIISYVSHFVGFALAWYVQSDGEEDKSLGTMTAILFFILALQTGLTTMRPEKRLIRLFRNMCLLCTAVLHFTHGMVNPVLMTLSATQHHNINKHVRPLSMCLFLTVFPVVFLYLLWQNNTLGTWLLAVTAFCIEVIVKVCVSFLVYTLFMIDAYRNVFWEKLDEYVYIVKACGNTIEFIFGIFLFCNGAWIMIFESGGTIRAFMMCVHAYFNIWTQAKEGWNTFIKRRSAVKKINCLPQATPEELVLYNDVCAICYQDMESACMTRCQHLFHSVCLRKWLYMQDVCPLCHEEVYTLDMNSSKQSEAAREQTDSGHLHQD